MKAYLVTFFLVYLAVPGSILVPVLMVTWLYKKFFKKPLKRLFGKLFKPRNK